MPEFDHTVTGRAVNLIREHRGNTNMTASKLQFWTNIGGGQTSDPLAIAQRAVALEAEGWDGGTGGAQAKALDPEFIDSFAIVGPPNVCLDRIRQIAALGFDRLHISTALPEDEHGLESHNLTVREIMPALRR
jgi:5,10-methylenetetrahydromethanopterin reductase